MVILQVASSSHTVGGYRRKTIFWPAPATTFRDSPYIHALNRALKDEIEACAIYAQLMRLDPVAIHARVDVATGFENHQGAGKELIKLIIAHRGLPDDQGSFSLGLARRILRICDVAPVGVSRRLSATTIKQMELRLINRYEELLALAPQSDIAILEDLLGQIFQLLDP